MRYSVAVAGATELVVTNLDVLSGFGDLNIATAYELAGAGSSSAGERQRTSRFPAFDLDHVQPVYERLPGFEGDITGVRTYADLPANARTYVEAIEGVVGVRVSVISVGPGSEQVIRR